ncbi:CMD domain protein, Avi_7170 family [Pseudomonas syringae]|uniref:CMD domain protein n=1 Tax=Pseudomonas syringae TaxID=317 RepID=UPI0008969E66|nr:CMD domain protein [Pseudomonas syringae]SDW75730.1 CMD domain protein, Avi_7170 family [Pseudomonas syringae]SFL94695.1 CMD domain protein, Avi_7170 family [Pseudomonas syringae]
MTPTAEHQTTPDLLDELLGIEPGSPLHTVRHAREKVASATQGSQQLFFDPALDDNLLLSERLWVAYYATRLSGQPTLSAHYLTQLQATGVEAVAVTYVDTGEIDRLDDPRLAAMLKFARTLIESPVHGDQSALQALQQHGLSTAEIVVLAQLVAFLSYQVRLAAGLTAMQSAGAAQ